MVVCGNSILSLSIFAGKTALYEVKTKDEEFTDITNQDLELGQAREIVRQIQEARKKQETRLDEKVDVILPAWPSQHEKYIKLNALANSLTKGEFQVKRL